jgi:hypothetical protein
VTRPNPQIETDHAYLTCAYAAPDGCRSAVGHLINDGEVNAYGEFQGNIFELLKRDGFGGKNVMRDVARVYYLNDALLSERL